MKVKTNEVIISGHNLDLTDAIKASVTEKMSKLFQHENHIIRLRVEVSHHNAADHQREFVARGIIEIRGPSLVATVHSEDLYQSIDLLTDKLDRMLRRRSRLRKVKRKNTHAVEIPAEIPKVAPA